MRSFARCSGLGGGYRRGGGGNSDIGQQWDSRPHARAGTGEPEAPHGAGRRCGTLRPGRAPQLRHKLQLRTSGRRGLLNRRILRILPVLARIGEPDRSRVRRSCLSEDGRTERPTFNRTGRRSRGSRCWHDSLNWAAGLDERDGGQQLCPADAVSSSGRARCPSVLVSARPAKASQRASFIRSPTILCSLSVSRWRCSLSSTNPATTGSPVDPPDGSRLTPANHPGERRGYRVLGYDRRSYRGGTAVLKRHPEGRERYCLAPLR